jgi:hypothetical protein
LFGHTYYSFTKGNPVFTIIQNDSENMGLGIYQFCKERFKASMRVKRFTLYKPRLLAIKSHKWGRGGLAVEKIQ